MVVFDPLAVLLLIAANISMQQRQKVTQVKPEPEPVKKKISEVDIPVFVAKEQPKEQPNPVVEVNKDNIIVIDEATGETIPPITKYDYDAQFSFREKDKL